MEEAFKITEAERVHNERIERSRGKLCGVCMEEIISMEPASEASEASEPASTLWNAIDYCQNWAESELDDYRTEKWYAWIRPTPLPLLIPG